MMQKDLNFFTVYKTAAAKNGSGLKGIIILVVVFVLLVGLTFGGLFFFRIVINGQIAAIKEQLQAPSVIEAQAKLEKEIAKNEFMAKYSGALIVAKKNFDKSRFIDSALLNAIQSSMPGDIVVSNLSINNLTIKITCSSLEKLSAATFCQALEAKNIFSSVTYTGLTKNTDSNGYTFDMLCTYKEEVSSK